VATTEATGGNGLVTEATASGAKLEAITTDAAKGFLARLSERGPDTIGIALGAFESDGALIGVAVLGEPSASSAPAVVAVAPERRRLKVGSDLLHALLAETARRGVRRVFVTYPAHSPSADALIRASGLVAARRVVNGLATVVLAVPEIR
jgi:GNAT superfamily N-acetyltransferase